MALAFTYNALDQDQNQGLVFKKGLGLITYTIDFANGYSSLTGVSTVALDSTGATVTSNCINTTTSSGTVVTVITKTCGAGGTAAAANGSRFRLRTTATNTGISLAFDVFIYVHDETYSPS